VGGSSKNAGVEGGGGTGKKFDEEGVIRYNRDYLSNPISTPIPLPPLTHEI